MECSIGKFLNKSCENSSYGKSDVLKHIAQFSSEDQLLLTLRSGAKSIESVCFYHEATFLDKYNHLFGGICCDPLVVHKKVIRKSLRTITLQFSELQPTLKLIPGKSLCSKCYMRVSEGLEEDFTHGEDVEIVEDRYEVPLDVVIDSVNKYCSDIGESPFKVQKLSKVKRSTAIKQKVKIKKNVAKKLFDAFGSAPATVLDTSDSEDAERNSDAEYLELIEKLKAKMKLTTSIQEKVHILSLVPRSWSKQKTCTEFQVSDYLVRKTRQLVKKYGILPQIEEKERNKNAMDIEVVKSVIEFYESDDSTHTRQCPGKKDYISVRNSNGEKIQKQKRLILCNLKELYCHFKKEHPNLKVGFSKFAQLRPKWCVLAGQHGTHTVCVCSIHQNVKLMISGAQLPHSYKDLISLIVCNIDSEACMLGTCADCPGAEAIRPLLNFSEEDKLLEDKVTFVQWMTTDRCDLVTVVDSVADFSEKLIGKLISLKAHHFIAVSQAAFLKNKKEALLNNECIISGDFSENFTFVVQDEIQSYHWVNAQATIHPFVVYYKDEESLTSTSICIISDCLQHSTTAVHTFLKYVIERIKVLVPHISKVYYFTDGAASQYKNRKNFVNLCHHKADFGLDAEWHFFATSHGKGPCDGIGGTVKRIVTKASLQRTTSEHILTPQKMFQFCEQEIKGIHFYFVPTDEVLKNEQNLSSRFDNSLTIPNTRENHSYCPKDQFTVIVRRTSTSVPFLEFPTIKNIPPMLACKIKVNDYVACTYGEKWYLGIVRKIDEEKEDYYINFFSPPGPSTCFKLTTNDVAWVPHSIILRLLTATELTTATGRSHNISYELGIQISSLMVNKK